MIDHQKPMSETKTKAKPILAVGAHPDDIEFGCGGILCRESGHGRSIHFLVCSRGESGSAGSAEERSAEAKAAANLVGADLRFLDFGGDGLIEPLRAHALAMARAIRELQPSVILAPSLVANQHPDHAAVGAIVRDGARLARYGGLEELRELIPHAIDSLCYYAITPGGEPVSGAKALIDVSPVVEIWKQLMERHATQMKTRRYVDLQLARARVAGLEMGREYAQAIWPADALVLEGLDTLPKGARLF